MHLNLSILLYTTYKFDSRKSATKLIHTNNYWINAISMCWPGMHLKNITTCKFISLEAHSSEELDFIECFMPTIWTSAYSFWGRINMHFHASILLLSVQLIFSRSAHKPNWIPPTLTCWNFLLVLFHLKMFCQSCAKSFIFQFVQFDRLSELSLL